MKALKFISTIILIFLTTIAVFSQTTDPVYDTGSTFGQFIVKNLWWIASTVFLLVDTWLAKSGNVKAASILEFIMNILAKIFNKDTSTQKAKFMTPKELAKAVPEDMMVHANTIRHIGHTIPIVLLLFFIGSTVNAQNLGRHITLSDFTVNKNQPLKAGYYTAKLNDTVVVYTNSKLFIRPALGLSVARSVWDKETKSLGPAKAAEMFGAGVTLQHYGQKNGQIFADWGVTGMIMTKTYGGAAWGIGVFPSYKEFQVGVDRDNHGNWGFSTGIHLVFY